ncbi:three-Cys-motif partner protein TcmP [Aureispira anguillae]|uniref:Three-Cys-motif partner protein TcmP n=1 Tax=Aureispira anguillae TaxID=2864201 RepID=A0A916DRH7_9BACT|nr:three-Cys-motif partner protein TcmP [Aureispira anguillae]BDS11271.1 three-Cys-motif partner protein TcmP [Aureispira anguillae]
MAKSIYYPTPKNELEVRSNIVLKYFSKWSSSLITNIKTEQLEEKFAVVDLAAGWELEEHNDAIITKLLDWATSQPQLRNMLSTIINDRDEQQIATITKHLTTIHHIELLRFSPHIHFSEVDNKLQAAISSIKTLPTLVLANWGTYKGLSFEFLYNLVHQSKSDCLLLFDYKKMSSFIHKKNKQEELARLLGAKTSTELQQVLKKRCSALKKEELITKAFEKKLKSTMGKGLLNPLKFKFYDHKNKASHFLYFLTQNQEAYTLMREIFCSESQIIEDGIGNLAYNPNKGAQQKITSPTLFGSMFELEQELLKTYQSQTLQIIDIYENHHLGRSLIKKNYIDALLNLEKKNKITVTRKRRPRIGLNNPLHLGDKVFVSFNK